MRQSSEHSAWPQYGKALAISAALLCATALGEPKLAYAGHGGGGGGGFHGGGFQDGRFGRDGFRDNRFFFGGAFAYPYGWDYWPDYGYYDYGQTYSAQSWYYCSDPAGYCPYVTQCNTGWQAVQAN